MAASETALREQKRLDDLADKLLSTPPAGTLNSHNSLVSPPTAWPDPPAPEAYTGLAGEIVKTIEPHSEADPVAILSQLLAMFGSIVGKGPHFRVEGDEHTSNIFPLVIGDTAKGRKGTSWGRVRRLCELIDDRWTLERIHSGLSSGEGLIWAVRDPIQKLEDGEDVTVDAGIEDKRLLVVESEFASVLRVLQRDGNTLSAIIRQAWDSGNICVMTKNNPASTSGAHISIIGHITANELRRYLDRTEAGNGFANRFLFLCVKRSKCLPHGGALSDDDLRPHAQALAQAVGFARTTGRVEMNPEARALWEAVYPRLSEGLPGMLGAITSRAEAQVIRLALLYALLDLSPHIGAPHLKAALALWDYCEASARYVFGSALGDPVADEILRALRAAGAQGLSRTDLSNLFKRHKDATTIGRALELLAQQGLAGSRLDGSGGVGRRKSGGLPRELSRNCESSRARIKRKMRKKYPRHPPGRSARCRRQRLARGTGRPGAA